MYPILYWGAVTLLAAWMFFVICEIVGGVLSRAAGADPIGPFAVANSIVYAPYHDHGEIILVALRSDSRCVYLGGWQFRRPCVRDASERGLQDPIPAARRRWTSRPAASERRQAARTPCHPREGVEREIGHRSLGFLELRQH
jgi:hypothetical protein